MTEACTITFVATEADQQQIYYIRFGSLLEFIQKDVMYYVKSTSGYTPMLKFDTDTKSNLMYIEEQFQTSVDPSICIINRDLVFEDVTYNVTKNATPTPDPFTLIFSSINAVYGQIMNIYLSMSWVLTKLDELKDPSTNKVVLIDFLNVICEGINSALGGISRLEPTIDENTNTVIIRDANPLPYSDEVIKNLNSNGYNVPTNLAEFNLFGYVNDEASFIKDFSFTTEISPALSTMITVGATANSEVVGENSTAFSKFNAGLKDRFKENVVQGDSINSPSPNLDQEEFDAIQQRYKDSLKAYFEYLANLDVRNFSSEEGIAYSDLLYNVITYQQQFREAVAKKGKIVVGSPVPADLKNQNFAASTGFIPFNMSLTMDGLSGMKIYNKFLIDTSYLPANYPDNAEFLIKNIAHKIENNKWTTTLESIVISKGGEIKKSKRGRTGRPSIQSSSSPTPSSIGAGSRQSKTITSGFYLNPSGHNPTKYKKTQIFFHYSAGQQLADQGKSVVDVLNARNGGKGLSYTYIIDAAGNIEQVIDESYVAYHAGINPDTHPKEVNKGKAINSPSIAINLMNLGYCKDANNSSYGPIHSSQTRGVRLVDWNGNPFTYRGASYAQEITDAQYNTLFTLTKSVYSRHPGIGSYKWEGEKTFQKLFPTTVGYTSPDKSYQVISSGGYGYGVVDYTSAPGLYSHCSVITSKLDIMPTPKIIDFFKKLVL